MRGNGSRRQRKLNYFSNHENGIVWARSWRATEGLPLGMRYAELGAARLAALDFLHDPEEPLIGRLAVPELDPAENERRGSSFTLPASNCPARPDTPNRIMTTSLRSGSTASAKKPAELLRSSGRRRASPQ